MEVFFSGVLNGVVALWSEGRMFLSKLVHSRVIWMGGYQRFTRPVVADGKVFVCSQSALFIYGLL